MVSSLGVKDRRGQDWFPVPPGSHQAGVSCAVGNRSLICFTTESGSLLLKNSVTWGRNPCACSAEIPSSAQELSLDNNGAPRWLRGGLMIGYGVSSSESGHL